MGVILTRMSPLPVGIRHIELSDGYPALEVETVHCSATLALHGAHLTHWQPSHTTQPVLYTSPTAVYREGKAIRGGIPLCWPWFNAHPSAPDQHPSHGVARNRFWTLESALVEDDVAEIILTLPPSLAVAEHVPFPFLLKAIFTLGKCATVSLETTNLSQEDIPVGGALHTYLALSNIDNITLAGLQHTPFLDTTTSPETTTTQDEDALTITNEVDRIYYDTPNPVILHDPSWNRIITVSKEGSLSTVIWNPWLEKASALSDLPNEAFRDFVCVEATNARHDTRILAPGASHTLASKITVASS